MNMNKIDIKELLNIAKRLDLKEEITKEEKQEFDRFIKFEENNNMNIKAVTSNNTERLTEEEKNVLHKMVGYALQEDNTEEERELLESISNKL